MLQESPNNLPQPKPGILEIAPYVGGKSQAKPGVRVVKLSSNETPLGPSPLALEAYVKAAAYLHRYPDGTAIKLREAIAKARKLQVDQIICGAGSDELIGLLVHAYAGAGDEVLYSQHGFLMYKIYAQSFGATAVVAQEKALHSDVDALLAAVTPRTKILFIANPNNPTGTYINKAEMKRLRDNLPPHIILAIDGAYAEYVLAEDYSCGRELVESTQNTVVLRTFSKIYGLSSLRLGWAYAPPAIINVLNRIRGPFNVSGPAIAAGIAAVQDADFIKQAQAFNLHWRNWLQNELTKLGLEIVTSAANFVLIGFPDGVHSAAKANIFLMERGLIPREVTNYGLPNYLRISIGLEEDNRAVVDALSAFLRI